MIRKCVAACDRGDAQVVLWGDGTATRDFLYVEDAAEGILLAAEHHGSSDPVNLGTGVETSIRQVAELVARVTGYTGKLVWDPAQPAGQRRRVLDTTRARAFGFAARTPLADGIARTVAWYLANRS
jgi:GDP-L-fucose synthase